MTENRYKLNNSILPLFRKRLNPKSIILNIGISKEWNPVYMEYFSDYFYKTVDKNKLLNPDYLLDMEGEEIYAILSKSNVDAIICHGVIEQTKNPQQFIFNIWDLLSDNGLLLITFISLNYPDYLVDNVRFTRKGAVNLLEKYFEIELLEFAHNGNEIEAYFFIGRKISK